MECQACQLTFTSHKRAPRVLTCGHSICTRCLSKLDACNECGKTIYAKKKNNRPVNYDLLFTLQNNQEASSHGTSLKSTLKGEEKAIKKMQSSLGSEAAKNYYFSQYHSNLSYHNSSLARGCGRLRWIRELFASVEGRQKIYNNYQRSVNEYREELTRCTKELTTYRDSLGLTKKESLGLLRSQLIEEKKLSVQKTSLHWKPMVVTINIFAVAILILLGFCRLFYQF